MKSLFHHSQLARKTALTSGVLSVLILSGCNVPAPDSVENTVNNSATANSATANATTSSAPSGELTKFVNIETGLKGQLKGNYVDFSLSYPPSWELKEYGRDVDAQNYMKIERALPDKTNGDFTLENLAVGFFKHSNNAQRNAELLPKTVKLLSDQFAAKLSNYKKVSEGPTKIGEYSGYQFLFSSTMKTPTKGEIPLWGRAVLLMEPKTTKGVGLFMLASSLAPEIKGPADIGVKGELPAILKTFKFEKPVASDGKN